MALKLIKSLLLIASMIWLSDACCPDQWFSIGGIQDKCFRFYGTPLTWNAALASCRAQSGSLLSIHSYAESYRIFNTWKSLSGSTIAWKAYWIGLSDEASEGNFVWADGSHNNYQAFVRGQPDNYGTGEDCVHAGTIGRNDGDRMRWNDIKCDEEMPFFCQKPLDS